MTGMAKSHDTGTRELRFEAAAGDAGARLDAFLATRMSEALPPR